MDGYEKRLAEIQKQPNSAANKLDELRSSSVVKTGIKMPIEGGFYNDYLKWKAKVGDVLKKGQVVAVCCMSKDMVVEYGSIVASADGVLLYKLFSDGASLHGKNVTIGYIQPR